jgi:phosphatidate cytidylyltransferase
LAPFNDMLKKRLLTALWGIPLLAAAVWFDAPLPWLTVLVALWGLLAVFEFYKLGEKIKLAPLTWFGLAWTLLFIISPQLNNEYLTSSTLLASGVVISLIWLIARRKQEGAFSSWAWTLGGILYVGFLLSYYVALRGLDDGRNWVFLALVVTFASDSAAYFVGRALGRHKLAPTISPGKTWEGTVGGFIGAIVIALLFTLPTPLQLPIGCGQAVILGVLISLFGQLGDLAESLLKRSTGVKDSGTLLAGHGGFLDRMDSIVFAGVVVYYYVVWFIL